jgi:hypothetical protein
MATLLYTASSVICTPNSLSQEVGLGLGAGILSFGTSASILNCRGSSGPPYGCGLA